MGLSVLWGYCTKWRLSGGGFSFSASKFWFDSQFFQLCSAHLQEVSRIIIIRRIIIIIIIIRLNGNQIQHWWVGTYFPRGMHGQKRHQPPNLRSQESEDSELRRRKRERDFDFEAYWLNKWKGKKKKKKGAIYDDGCLSPKPIKKWLFCFVQYFWDIHICCWPWLTKARISLCSDSLYRV